MDAELKPQRQVTCTEDQGQRLLSKPEPRARSQSPQQAVLVYVANGKKEIFKKFLWTFISMIAIITKKKKKPYRKVKAMFKAKLIELFSF